MVQGYCIIVALVSNSYCCLFCYYNLLVKATSPHLELVGSASGRTAATSSDRPISKQNVSRSCIIVFGLALSCAITFIHLADNKKFTVYFTTLFNSSRSMSKRHFTESHCKTDLSFYLYPQVAF